MNDVIDPETGGLIDVGNVLRLIRQYRATNREHARRAIANQLLTYGVAIDRARKELVRKLEAGHRILPMNRERDAFTAKQEAQERVWMDWLMDYELICDVIGQIEQGVLLGRWDAVTERRAS